MTFIGGGWAGKSHWPVTPLKAYGGRLATDATVEPSSSKRGYKGSRTLDGRAGWWAGLENDSPAAAFPFPRAA